MASETKCRICGNTKNHQIFKVKEMMFGTKEEFEYFLCQSCNTLQISDIPNDLSKYYPDDYYSFSNHNSFSIKRFLKKAILDYQFTNSNFLGYALSKFFDFDYDANWFAFTGVNKDSFILDIGCGQGEFIKLLGDIGYKNVYGADPFIEKEIDYKNGVKIFKNEINEISGEYDLIMLHHSFEHMLNPISTLEEIHRLLKPNAFALIRIPVIDSYAWEKYGINWVQLDAPRHIFLHSKRSMEYLANQTGFQIKAIEYDSNGFQFWASEQYKMGIPLNSPKAYNGKTKGSIFSKSQIIELKKKLKY